MGAQTRYHGSLMKCTIYFIFILFSFELQYIFLKLELNSIFQDNIPASVIKTLEKEQKAGTIDLNMEKEKVSQIYIFINGINYSRNMWHVAPFSTVKT